jgi:hypothetical protein
MQHGENEAFGCVTSHLHDAAKYVRMSLAAQPFDSLSEPFGFFHEARRAIYPIKSGVALGHVDADAPLKFPETDRTEMQRAAIAFDQMI